MNIRTFAQAALAALVSFFALLSPGQAQTYGPETEVCSPSAVAGWARARVAFSPGDCAQASLTTYVYANGVWIGSQCSGGGATFYNPSYINLSAQYVSGWAPTPFNPRFDGGCPVVYEDNGTGLPEGYIYFYVSNLINPSLSVSKSASPPVFAVGASGQRYLIVVSVSNGPTTAPLAISDSLPAGITTSGPITSSGGNLSGCPAAGASSLSGCTLAAGVNGSITLTVPVQVAASATSHSSFQVTNTASASDGGISTCVNNCSGSTTNPVILALNDVDTKPTGVPSSSDVSPNDAYPPGSTFTATGGTCSNPTPFTPSSNTSGVLGYTVPPGSSSCTVNYQLCAPAPNATVCSNATLTVTSSTPPVATLTIRQTVQGPVPAALRPPYAFSYSGNNGWPTQTLTNTSLNSFTSSPAATLSATQVATTVGTSLPEPRWFVTSYSCVDLNAAVSGNPSGTLVETQTTSVTIPAQYVVAGANLRCTMTLGHLPARVL